MINAHAISERISLLIHYQIARIVDEHPDILMRVNERVNGTIEMTGGTSGEQIFSLS